MNLRPATRRDEPEISVVALIDVLLLLLVFFLLSTRFTTDEEGRLRVRLPQANAVPAAKAQLEPLVVTVSQAGTYRVNEHELINSSPETLRSALLKEAGTKRDMPVTVRADGRATHQSVVTAMDVLGRLGFVELRIATVNQDHQGKP
jgi:biopolymer transport protein ExbD